MKPVNSYQLKYKNLNLNRPYLAFFRVNMIISSYISVFIDSDISCRPSLFKLISSRKLFNKISHLSINIFEQKLNHLETMLLLYLSILIRFQLNGLKYTQNYTLILCICLNRIASCSVNWFFEKDLLISFDNLHKVRQGFFMQKLDCLLQLKEQNKVNI